MMLSRFVEQLLTEVHTDMIFSSKNFADAQLLFTLHPLFDLTTRADEDFALIIAPARASRFGEFDFTFFSFAFTKKTGACFRLKSTRRLLLATPAQPAEAFVDEVFHES